MQNLMIRLPDAAYRAALSFSPAERERLFAVAITTAHAALEDDEEPDFDRETNEADLESIGRGLADLEAGRTIPGDVVLAALME